MTEPALELVFCTIKFRVAVFIEPLYQSEAIYKTIDKVSFNAQVTHNHSFNGSDLH